jgi:hypothetical protein
MEYEAVTAEIPMQCTEMEITLEKVAGIWSDQNYSKQYRARIGRKSSAAQEG